MRSLNAFASAFILLLILPVSPAMAVDYAGACELCATPITDSSNRFVIVDVDGFEHEYGCPGCGLSVLATMPDTTGIKARVEDFLRRTLIDADQAYYLRGTSIGFCCQPYWLAFSSREDAERFSKGFGGEVLDYEAAIKTAPQDHMHHHH